MHSTIIIDKRHFKVACFTETGLLSTLNLPSGQKKLQVYGHF